MKKLLRKLLASTVCVSTALLLAGCAGPLWQFPGGALAGTEQKLNLETVPPSGGVIQLETNPDDPYSVNVGYIVIEGNMYIDPAESRTWYQNIKSNPLIRIRFDSASVVHPAIAIAETDASIIDQFEKDRHVLRLQPRDH